MTKKTKTKSPPAATYVIESDIRRKLDTAQTACHLRAARSLKEATRSLHANQDTDAVLGHVLDALLSIGEERGIANSKYDLLEDL